MYKTLFQKEAFASVHEVQAGLSRLLTTAEKHGILYRVLRNNKPIGVLMPNRTWESFYEDLLALQSPAYLHDIQAARKEKRRIPLKQLRSELNLK